jgi:hypothetical protein
VTERMKCRSDVEAIFDAAWRAGAFLPMEPWMYMVSVQAFQAGTRAELMRLGSSDGAG